MNSMITDLRTVLMGSAGTASVRDSEFDLKRILKDGARAFLTGLTTSPYHEGSKEEEWWRLGWQLSKEAVKSSKGAW